MVLERNEWESTKGPIRIDEVGMHIPPSNPVTPIPEEKESTPEEVV
jgi:hypothetical protein